MKISPLIPILLLATACAQIKSEKVAQSEIHTDYSSRYDEGAKTLSFEARFQVGDGTAGTQVRLSGKSTVKLNGAEMTEKSDIVKQISYRYSVGAVSPDRIDEAYEIVYLDNDGKEYKNYFRIPKRITATFPESARRSGFEIGWEVKDKLRPGETIYALLTFNNGFLMSQEQKGSLTSGKIFINASELSKANERGSGAQVTEAHVCRESHSDSVSAPAVGGSMVSEYCTPRSSIQLE